MSVLAIVPARIGSKGIPEKNWRALPDGTTCVGRAIACTDALGIDDAYISTDDVSEAIKVLQWNWAAEILERPAHLAQDDTPMLAVVQHALEQIPGPPDQIIVLLQPTAPVKNP